VEHTGRESKGHSSRTVHPRWRIPLKLVALVLVAAALVGPVLPGRAADIGAGRRKAEPCAACHGPDGNATLPGTPSLAAQPAWFTHWALIKFRDGRRQDPVMSPLAAPLADADLADLAAYYAAQPARPRAQAVDPARAAEGKPLADAHHCTQCHRPDLSGQDHVPRLAGQDLQYLLKMLRAYRARTAADLDGFMTMAAQPLTDAEIDALAHHIAGLPPPPVRR
jgi:cytochrome c553